MKKLTLLTILLCGILLSCKKKEDDNPANNSQKNFITMKIDGADWAADASSVAGGLGVLSDARLIIGGDNAASYDNFVISLENISAAGTYTTSDAQSYVSFFHLPPDESKTQMYCSKQDGKFTVQVTKATKTAVSGTFSGILEVQAGNNTTPIQITDGKFNYNR